MQFLKRITLLTISVCFCSTLVYSQDMGQIKIGKVGSDTWEILLDESDIDDAWTSAIQEAGIEIDFSQFEIVKNIDGIYYFLGSNIDQTLVTAVPLVENNGYLYEALLSGRGQTIICSGCNIGCKPDNSSTKDGSWACLPSCSPDDCIKTVTITVNAIFAF